MVTKSTLRNIAMHTVFSHRIKYDYQYVRQEMVISSSAS